MLPNYYEVFGIDQTATKEEIKKRYRELAKRFHPDVNKSSDATSRMQQIQEAYYILYDDEARNRYDIQYARFFGSRKKESQFDYRRSEQQSQTHEERKYDLDDPLLEKWIINARKQAVDFVKNLYRDTKGIAASGCSYYFKALGICLIIYIVIVIIVNIVRAFNN